MDIDLEEDYCSWPTVWKSGNKPATKQTMDMPMQRTVTYCNTGVQTLPPSDTEAFRAIYNREPKQGDLINETVTEAIVRYTAGVGSGPYETIVNIPFLAPVPGEAGTTYSDASFQTLSTKDCKISIAQAKVKAFNLVAKQCHVAQASGYKIWCEKKADKTVHAEQFPVRVRIDENGRVTDTDAHEVMLPNICGEKIVSTAASENESAVVWSRTLSRNRISADASTDLSRILPFEAGSSVEVCQPWVPEQLADMRPAMDTDEPGVPKRSRWDLILDPYSIWLQRREASERTTSTHSVADEHNMYQDLTEAQNTSVPMDVDDPHEASEFSTCNRTNMDEVPSTNLLLHRTSDHPSARNHEHNHYQVSEHSSGSLTRVTDTSVENYIMRLRNEREANPETRDTSFLDYVMHIRDIQVVHAAAQEAQYNAFQPSDRSQDQDYEDHSQDQDYKDHSQQPAHQDGSQPQAHRRHSQRRAYEHRFHHQDYAANTRLNYDDGDSSAHDREHYIDPYVHSRALNDARRMAAFGQDPSLYDVQVPEGGAQYE